MAWILFVRLATNKNCCNDCFRYIFVKDSSAFRAMDKVTKRIFNCGADHEFISDECVEGESEQDVWNKSKIARQHCGLLNVDEILYCSDVLVINDNRIIMPNGTDGLICEGECKEFWPYVEKNMDDKFICIKCR